MIAQGLAMNSILKKILLGDNGIDTESFVVFINILVRHCYSLYDIDLFFFLQNIVLFHMKL
jgi:hypothetical protein